MPEAMPRRLPARMDQFTGYGMSETCPVLTIAHMTRRSRC